MKLLIRTISLGVLLFFMSLIVLHCTIVETTKQQLNTASVNALYRTIDAYEENQKLISEGDVTNLYFNSDQDYYYYFYDSLMVQLNGKMELSIICNETNVETGDLDVDITATYKAVGKEEKTYTVHVDTYGKISETINYTDEQKVIVRKLASAKVGQKIKWAGHDWYFVSDYNDKTILLLAEDIGTGIYGKQLDYGYSYLQTSIHNFGVGLENYSDKLYNEALDDLETMNGGYTINGTDQYSGYSYALSYNQAELLRNSGISGHFWLRTASGNKTVKAYNNGEIEDADISAELGYRPAVTILKSKLTRLTELEDGTYELDSEASQSSWGFDDVLNVGWDVRNDDILATINTLDNGTYKLSALVTLTDIDNAQIGDRYGIKLNDLSQFETYSQLILNNPNYLEFIFTIDDTNKATFSDLRLYGCGTVNQTGSAIFSNIKIEYIGE